MSERLARLAITLAGFSQLTIERLLRRRVWKECQASVERLLDPSWLEAQNARDQERMRRRLFGDWPPLGHFMSERPDNSEGYLYGRSEESMLNRKARYERLESARKVRHWRRHAAAQRRGPTIPIREEILGMEERSERELDGLAGVNQKTRMEILERECAICGEWICGYWHVRGSVVNFCGECRERWDLLL